MQPYEALPEEKEAVKAYALKHPELRHRELTWRMVDEDVAYLGASTVYRILREAKLVCPWRRRSKRRREEDEKATRPDEIWATDIKYVWVGERDYFLVSFLDEKGRPTVVERAFVLPPGSRLPSTRALAHQLAVHRNTIVAAYRWREIEGQVMGGAEHSLRSLAFSARATGNVSGPRARK